MTTDTAAIRARLAQFDGIVVNRDLDAALVRIEYPPEPDSDGSLLASAFAPEEAADIVTLLTVDVPFLLDRLAKADQEVERLNARWGALEAWLTSNDAANAGPSKNTVTRVIVFNKVLQQMASIKASPKEPT